MYGQILIDGFYVSLLHKNRLLKYKNTYVCSTLLCYIFIFVCFFIYASEDLNSGVATLHQHTTLSVTTVIFASSA
jgi:hypothetical protein